MIRVSITIRQIDEECKLRITPFVKGDTPKEKDVLKQFAYEMASEKNPVHKCLLEMCAKLGVKME